MIGRALLAAVTLSAVPYTSFAQGQDQPQQQPLEAGKENSGRVSVIDGNGAIYGRGPYDDETWELSVNAVVREGDELFTDDGAYAELELPRQTFVRLDGDTTIVLQRVTEQGIELALAKGTVYVSRGNGSQPAMVQTFGGAVELGGNSMARVGNDDRKTQIDIKVAKGSAELRSEKTAIAVPENKTLVWTKGGSSRSDAWSAARYDDFDRWNQTRENTVRGYTYPTSVSSSAMGAYELEGNGTWVMIDGYSAWRPTVAVADWRPYSYGHWSWCEPWGWTWVDDYRWGYTTSHYGRWYYRSHYGWVWYPDAYWGGSWVVWAAFGPNIGWAPCDYYGRPIYVYSYYSYYDYGAWCYSDANYFYTGGGYRPRGVRTSTSRTSGTRTSIGRSGNHSIRQFDQNTIRQYNAVPVRNARTELTPKHVADAAGRGEIKGVKADQRKGDFLARAVKDGGVRPEPWAADRRGGSGASGNDRSAFGGDKGGRDPVRSNEGWGTPGQNTRNGNNDSMRGASPNVDRGGNTNTPSYDRGGNTNTPSYDRGGSSNTPSYDRGNNNSSGGGWTPPARTAPAPRNDPPPQRAPSNDSNRSSPPPKQDNSSDRNSNDSNKSDSKPRPRSGWSNSSASSRASSGSSRGTDAYTYDTRGGSRKPAPTTRAPSAYDTGSKSSRGASSYQAPSYNSNSSRGSSSAPSYKSNSSRGSSAPSYSAPSSRKSSPSYSAPRYSAPKSSSGKSSYSAPKSSGSSKSSGRSSSSSSKSSSSSSSSKSDSGKSSGRRK